MKTAPNTPSEPSEETVQPPQRKKFFVLLSIAAAAVTVGGALFHSNDLGPVEGAGYSLALFLTFTFVVILTGSTLRMRWVDRIGAPAIQPRDERERKVEADAYRVTYVALMVAGLVGGVISAQTWMVLATMFSQILWLGLRWYGDWKL